MSSELMEESGNWKSQVMLIGGIVGLLAGLAAAYLLVQRAERDNAQPQLHAREGVKLGVLVFGLLREIAQLGDGR
jgi:hypothetical protein